jgi:hypothetical protein
VVQGSRVPGHAFLFAFRFVCFWFRVLLFFDFLFGVVKGYTPTLGALVVAQVAAGHAWSSGYRARGFSFPSQWFIKCPEVFWFHPAELGKRVFFGCVLFSPLVVLITASNVNSEANRSCFTAEYFFSLSL